ncbi:hypothetical protein KSP35_08990 [Aquihabitans sp. G128]|uniref:RNA polymerase sigma factor n=1 Tax=Aquihabitans sp. G128 TaxID=2849779 RepID=UPI001C237A06|nr:hypothetical protein [Aquihabitans sp. G128]QXC62897.1 hypothetical protein KSP35_08990 [Aquihabitans sp. G128]
MTDDDAEAHLFRELYPPLRRFAAVVAPLDVDPDDLVHEALVRTLDAQRLGELDHPLVDLRRSTLAIAGRLDRPSAAPRSGASSPSTSPVAALDRADASDRAAVYLADVEGLPAGQVGAALGIRPTAARVVVRRARRRLGAEVQAAAAAPIVVELVDPAARPASAGGGDRADRP